MQIGARLTTGWTRVSPTVRQASLAWLGGRLLLTLWGLLIAQTGMIPDPVVQAEHYYNLPAATDGLLGIWQRWDTLHYQRIALHGYGSSPELSAFFPLYPLLARSLSRLTGLDVLPALLVVSNLAFWLTLMVLYRLLEDEYGAKTAGRAVAAAVLFPTSFFFYAGYPLSLALLLTLLAYRFARRERWLFCALAGVLAGLAHSTVMPLAVMLLVEAGQQQREQRTLKDGLKLLAALSPLMGVALFLAWRAGQGFPPLAALMANVWDRVVQPPWRTLLDLPVQFRTGPVYGSLYSDIALLALMLAACAWGWKRLRLPEWFYHTALLGYLLVTTIQGQPLASFGRYMLMSYPMFLLAGQLAEKKGFRLAGFAVGLTTQLFLSAVFFIWGWVD